MDDSADIVHRLYGYDIEHTGTCDAGEIYEITCPDCGEKVKLAEGSEYWSTDCSCGLKWSIQISAEARRK